MKAIVSEDLCIGCEACVDACEAVFKMEGDKAIVIADPIPADQEDASKEAADSCPVDAITFE